MLIYVASLYALEPLKQQLILNNYLKGYKIQSLSMT